jgi:hypothetical protein
VVAFAFAAVVTLKAQINALALLQPVQTKHRLLGEEKATLSTTAEKLAALFLLKDC